MSNIKVKKAKKFATIGLLISASARRDKMDAKARKITDEHTMSLSRTVSMLSTESLPLADLEQQMTIRQLRTEKPIMLAVDFIGGAVITTSTPEETLAKMEDAHIQYKNYLERMWITDD